EQREGVKGCLGMLWQTPAKLILECPSKIKRKERLPECFSCVSRPIWTPRDASEISQEKPPFLTFDSNPPSHKTEPGGPCRSAKPAKRTAWSQTRLASAMRRSTISALTRGTDSGKEMRGRRTTSRAHTLSAFWVW